MGAYRIRTMGTNMGRGNSMVDGKMTGEGAAEVVLS